MKITCNKLINYFGWIYSLIRTGSRQIHNLHFIFPHPFLVDRSHYLTSSRLSDNTSDEQILYRSHRIGFYPLFWNHMNLTDGRWHAMAFPMNILYDKWYEHSCITNNGQFAYTMKYAIISQRACFATCKRLYVSDRVSVFHYTQYEYDIRHANTIHSVLHFRYECISLLSVKHIFQYMRICLRKIRPPLVLFLSSTPWSISSLLLQAQLLLLHFFVDAKLENIVTHQAIRSRGPSQYKDRLIYVWRFPC